MSIDDLEKLEHEELIDLILELQDNNELLCLEIEKSKKEKDNKTTKDFNKNREFVCDLINGIVNNSNAKNINVKIDKNLL